jgi:hypothetical protein
MASSRYKAFWSTNNAGHNRHCERSEAIHDAAKEAWIASSLRSSQ